MNLRATQHREKGSKVESAASAARQPATSATDPSIPDPDILNPRIPDPGKQGPRRLDPALRRFLVWVMLLIGGGYTFLDYWNYNRNFLDLPGGEWDLLLHGRYYAPAQYRIGVVRTGALLARLLDIHLRHAFAIIDCLCLTAAMALLLWLLTRSAAFRRASHLGQWLQANMAFGCFLLYLLWSFWYQKPETHPILLFLVLSAQVSQRRRRIPAASALVLLAALGATVRADTAVAFPAGFLAASLLRPGRSLPLGRVVQAVASGLSILAAVAVEYFIIHWLYPSSPRSDSAFLLIHNASALLDYVVLAASLFPWWITLWLAGRRWHELDGWSLGLLLGSLLQFGLFFVMGAGTEVRIMLPYTMAMVPITVTFCYRAIEQSRVDQSRADARTLPL